jgi:hypothetical protein
MEMEGTRENEEEIASLVRKAKNQEEIASLV